jgi:hypothetical protein
MPPGLPPLHRANKHPNPNTHAPVYNAHTWLDQLMRVDLVAHPGLHATTVPTMLSDIRLDQRKWPNAKRRLHTTAE